MARPRKREVQLPFWEVSLTSWDVGYHFGTSPRTKHFPDQFSEITTLELAGHFFSPTEWQGISVTICISGSRDLEAFLGLGYPPEKLIFPASPSDHALTHIGHVRPVLKTRLPRSVHMDAKLPHDMVFRLAYCIENRLVRTLQVFSAGETKGDPKAHWIRSLTFQRDPDPDPDLPTT